jgi:hypothetical protein
VLLLLLLLLLLSPALSTRTSCAMHIGKLS